MANFDLSKLMEGKNPQAVMLAETRQLKSKWEKAVMSDYYGKYYMLPNANKDSSYCDGATSYSITFSVMILMTSLFIMKPDEFSSFPTVLWTYFLPPVFLAPDQKLPEY